MKAFLDSAIRVRVELALILCRNMVFFPAKTRHMTIFYIFYHVYYIIVCAFLCTGELAYNEREETSIFARYNRVIVKNGFMKKNPKIHTYLLYIYTLN